MLSRPVESNFTNYVDYLASSVGYAVLSGQVRLARWDRDPNHRCGGSGALRGDAVSGHLAGHVGFGTRVDRSCVGTTGRSIFWQADDGFDGGHRDVGCSHRGCFPIPDVVSSDESCKKGQSNGIFTGLARIGGFEPARDVKGTERWSQQKQKKKRKPGFTGQQDRQTADEPLVSVEPWRSPRVAARVATEAKHLEVFRGCVATVQPFVCGSDAHLGFSKSESNKHSVYAKNERRFMAGTASGDQKKNKSKVSKKELKGLTERVKSIEEKKLRVRGWAETVAGCSGGSDFGSVPSSVVSISTLGEELSALRSVGDYCSFDEQREAQLRHDHLHGFRGQREVKREGHVVFDPAVCGVDEVSVFELDRDVDQVAIRAEVQGAAFVSEMIEFMRASGVDDDKIRQLAERAGLPDLS